MERTKKCCSCGRGLVAAVVAFGLGLFFVSLLAEFGINSRPTVNVYAGQDKESARRAEEIFLAQRIVNVLEPIVGKDKVRAEVSLVVDHNTVATAEEVYDPEGQVLRSYKAAHNFASEGEYALNKYNRLTIREGGRIKRMSVLVQLENTMPIIAENYADYVALIAPVIGFVPARGDQIRFENLPVKDSLVSPILVCGAACVLLLILGGLLLVVKCKKSCRKSEKTIPQVPVWKKLEQKNAKDAAMFLQNEDAAVVAYVLGKMNSETASRILNQMSFSQMMDVLLAMSENAPLAPDVAEAVEHSLDRKISEEEKNKIKNQNLGKLFSLLSPEKQRKMLSLLEQQNADLAEKLRQKMFNFEDFINVKDKDIKRMFDVVEAEVLAMALRGASEKLKNHLFANMNGAAVDFIKQKMGAQGPVRLVDVEAAQSEIITQAQELAAQGKITLVKNDTGAF